MNTPVSARRATALAFISAVACLAPRSAATQERYGYVYLVGTDTTGIERIAVSNGSFSGNLAFRGQPRIEWQVAFTAAATQGVLSLVAYATAAPDAPVVQRATLELVGDSVRFESGRTKRMMPTRRGAFILQGTSAAFLDLLFVRALQTQMLVDTIPVFLTSGGQTLSAIVRTVGDSGFVTIAGQETRAALGPSGMRDAYVSSQGLRMVRLTATEAAHLTLGAEDYNPPAGAPYRAEHVRIVGKGGHQLSATLTLPAGVARAPVVITISGSGGQDRDSHIPLVRGYRPFRQIADTLGRRGIATLRYDDRGIGESTGSFMGATSADFADDVRAAIAFVRARPDIEPEAVFLVGHSEGGMIAPMVAVDDANLAGLVLMAGPIKNGKDILIFQNQSAINRDTSLKTPQARDSVARQARAQVDSLEQRDPWMRFFFRHDAAAVAKRVKTPALVLQGGTDQQVTPDQAELLGAALRSAGNTDVTVRLLADRNHLFLPDADGNPANYAKATSGKLGPDVLGAIADWVAARTGSR